jgi:hypothetical protein
LVTLIWGRASVMVTVVAGALSVTTTPPGPVAVTVMVWVRVVPASPVNWIVNSQVTDSPEDRTWPITESQVLGSGSAAMLP